MQRTDGALTSRASRRPGVVGASLAAMLATATPAAADTLAQGPDRLAGVRVAVGAAGDIAVLWRTIHLFPCAGSDPDLPFVADCSREFAAVRVRPAGRPGFGRVRQTGLQFDGGQVNSIAGEPILLAEVAVTGRREVVVVGARSLRPDGSLPVPEVPVQVVSPVASTRFAAPVDLPVPVVADLGATAPGRDGLLIVGLSRPIRASPQIILIRRPDAGGALGQASVPGRAEPSFGAPEDMLRLGPRAVQAGSRAAVVWTQAGALRLAVQSTPSAAPDLVLRVAPAPGRGLRSPRVGLGDDGRVTVAWTTGPAASRTAFAATLAPGESALSSPVPLVAAGRVPDGGLELDRSGRVAAFIRAGRVQVATQTDQRTWSAARPLSGPGVAGGLAVAGGPNGRVAVSWIRAGALQVAVRPAPGRPFGPVRTLATAGVQQQSIAIAPNGRPVVAWIARDRRGFSLEARQL